MSFGTSNSYELRQACVHGLGIAAQLDGEAFTPFAGDAVTALAHAITAPNVSMVSHLWLKRANNLPADGVIVNYMQFDSGEGRGVFRYY